ncbi:MAG: PAS domain-containing sensor histidine kinase [Alphaproteobacteria bacterium]|nr:PAS domain-containing sensor histidine kinase [Alphaproteobacteria bacterium]
MSISEAPPRFEAAPRDARSARLRAGAPTAILALATLAAGAVTYAAWRGLFGIEVSPRLVLVLSLATFFICLSFVAMAAWWVVKIAKARREGVAGARLHTRLTSLFVIVAIVPIVTVAVFAVLTLTFGIETWFSDRVRNVLDSAEEVATRYLDLQQDSLKQIVEAYAKEVNVSLPLIEEERNRFENWLADRGGGYYGLLGTFIIKDDGTVLAFARAENLTGVVLPPPAIYAQAQKGPVILEARKDSLLFGLVKLDDRPDAYLYVIRPIDPNALALARRAFDAKAQYEIAEASREDVQIKFYAFFLALSFVLLLVAIWLGIRMAARIVAPIGRLLTAAERVSEGDLAARVEVDRSDDELGMLGRAFNRMTGQLKTQRDELIEANRQYDRRRRFTEAVLAGVSAGVLGLDQRGVVTIANRSALTLLGRRLEDVIGRRLDALVLEMAPLVARAVTEGEPTVEGEIEIQRDGRTRHLIVRVTRESGIAESHGHVVTFDDITNLVAAQRMSAWADVARRIAHEIKNPLTPIQLSAERLKRKYARDVTKDPDVFVQCTDTIIRQVGDLQRMVDEFSAFARMPAPTMGRNDLAEIVRQAVFLQRVADPEIEFHVDVPEGGLSLVCDGRQVSQALINVLKNATEAIEARRQAGAGEPFQGRIDVRVHLEEASGEAVVDVVDNGCGLPTEDRYRLTEPYRTTRTKGTGLGLAIVRKILEDHGGRLELEDAPRGEGTDADVRGAWIRMVLKLDRAGAPTSERTEARERVVTETGIHGG